MSPSQDDGRTYYNIAQGSVNEIGSGYDTDGAGTPTNEDGTGFYRIEVPVGAISAVTYTDDGIWFELGNLILAGNLHIESVGLSNVPYGALSGVIDGANRVYTTSGGSYISGTLVVEIGKIPMVVGDAGSGHDVEETDPSAGQFRVNTAYVLSGSDFLVARFQT